MRALFAIPLMLALSGCNMMSGDGLNLPIGIGGGANELRRAPCACLEKDQPAGLPDFLQGGESEAQTGEGTPA